MIGPGLQPFTFVSVQLEHPVERDKQSYSALLKMCLWKWGNKEFCEEAFFACRQSFRALDPHLPIRQSLVMFEGSIRARLSDSSMFFENNT